MDRFKAHRSLGDRRRFSDEQKSVRDLFGSLEELGARPGEANTLQIIKRHLEERARKTTRRKWGGRALIVLGVFTVFGSFPFYMLSLIPGQSVAAGLAIMIGGLAMIAGGGLLSSWSPRLKDTNEALLVALKHGNRLTIPLLALEMDVSFEKAEQIIQELVKKGIAEIELTRGELDHAIVYQIKGI